MLTILYCTISLMISYILFRAVERNNAFSEPHAFEGVINLVVFILYLIAWPILLVAVWVKHMRSKTKFLQLKLVIDLSTWELLIRSSRTTRNSDDVRNHQWYWLCFGLHWSLKNLRHA